MCIVLHIAEQQIGLALPGALTDILNKIRHNILIDFRVCHPLDKSRVNVFDVNIIDALKLCTTPKQDCFHHCTR